MTFICLVVFSGNAKTKEDDAANEVSHDQQTKEVITKNKSLYFVPIYNYLYCSHKVFWAHAYIIFNINPL